MPIPMTPALVAALERTELAVWSAMYRAAPPAAVTGCGLGIRDFPPAVAMWMSKVDLLACNRVVGLDLDGPPDRKTIEAIVDSFEQAMIPRFCLQLAPLVTVGPTITAVTDVGFAPAHNWVRLVRDVTSPGPSSTKLRIEEIGLDLAATFGQILAGGFGWNADLVLPVMAMVGVPKWKFYLAYLNDHPIGTAILVTDDKIGWLGFATTMPEARGHGTQSALIARRILDARTAGCEVLTAETAEQEPKEEEPSYRNILRSGFEVGYIRPNYLYQFQQRDSA